ncbi:hypothetical protein RCH18_000338 [Flavobacterium sp. PL11]|jgi:hypothetical protein|nr:hypothetical protein [Flavobacterium sp. PL11]
MRNGSTLQGIRFHPLELFRSSFLRLQQKIGSNSIKLYVFVTSR